MTINLRVHGFAVLEKTLQSGNGKTTLSTNKQDHSNMAPVEATIVALHFFYSYGIQSFMHLK